MRLTVRPATRQRRTPSSPVLNRRPSIAALGEELAAAHLEDLGFEILVRNWRDKRGELDIIARDRAARRIVIVEVRTVSSDRFRRPEDTVAYPKQRQVAAQAKRWMASNAAVWQGWSVCFDVVGVVLETSEIRHYPNAFVALG
jgi:putative endonuclease